MYSYLRNKRDLKTGVPSLEMCDGSRTSLEMRDGSRTSLEMRDGSRTSLEMRDGSRTRFAAESAEVLADAFSSVFVLEPECLPDDMHLVNTNELLSEIVITCEDVQSELKTLNVIQKRFKNGST